MQMLRANANLSNITQLYFPAACFTARCTFANAQSHQCAMYSVKSHFKLQFWGDRTHVQNSL